MSPASNRERVPDLSPRWWTIGAPCAMVVAMLGLSVLLSAQATDPPGPSSPVDPASRAVEPAELAARDLQRLSSEPSGWTLQFMVACEESTLHPLLAQLENEPDLFLLPHRDAGEDCYRICWGRFRTRQAAQRPRAYPQPLRSVGGPPWPVAVSDLLP